MGEVWEVQVGKGKGSYKTRYRFERSREAWFYYTGINIGLGYKKRLVKIVGAKRMIVARSFS